MSTLSLQLTLSDFDYELPGELIAQTPAPARDASRLLVLDRRSGEVRHSVFSELGSFLQAGDLLVLNDTKVFPCRLLAKKPGGGKAEIFLLEELGKNLWRALIRGGIDAGKAASIAQGVEAEITEKHEDGTRTVRFRGIADIRSLLSELGRTPLPPYIKREPLPEDRERYQTVYAAREGAVAAPTAGLHFTEGLLQSLRECGIGTAALTLHVGPGTFQPVRTERLADHRMHAEQYDIPGETADRISRVKAGGGRVVAVGTTTVRALETAALPGGAVQPGAGSSDLFIAPGFTFPVVDGMITNFHLPRTTLLMLVSAFAGRERVLEAYRIAVQERYRFYSYGDAMLVL